MKKELAATQSKLGQERTQQEKEHLKIIFIQVLEKITKGETGPGAAEMLKIFCSLIDCTEQEKATILSMAGGKPGEKRKSTAGPSLMGFMKK